MLLIDDKVVSLDIVEQFFCCDLDRCLGQCCIEGDAGAPLLSEEVTQLRKALPVVADDLTPSARRVIEEQGVCYRDKDGDLVTSLADGEACVFSTFAPGGKCLCALEKAHREGRLDFCKPISCALYPIRVTKYPSFTALNYHRWKICKSAEVCGREKHLRVYQVLREPLVRAFGKEWYDKLCHTAEEYLRQNPRKSSHRDNK